MDSTVNTPLSTNERKPLVYPLAVWAGFIIVVGTMAAGGSLTTIVSYDDIVIITLITNVILGGIAAIFGYVGALSGKNFALLASDAFPGRSSRLVALYVPIVLCFWFAVISSIFAQYIGATFGLNDTATLILSAAACYFLSITSYYGMTSLSILSLILVPIIMVLASYAVFEKTLPPSSIDSQLSNWQTVNGVAGVILSTWIMGATINIPDITRFCRSPWQGALIGFLGIFIANSFNIIIGARAALIGGQADPAPLLVALGLPALGFVLVIANLWTTNDNNMYSASLGLAKAGNLARRKSVILLATVAAALALFKVGQLNYILNGIMLMGTTAPALGGVVLSQYILSNRMGNATGKAWLGWLSWIIGAITANALAGSLGVASGLVIAFAVHYLFSLQALRWVEEQHK